MLQAAEAALAKPDSAGKAHQGAADDGGGGGGGGGGGLVAVILVAVAAGLCCVSGWVCEGAAWWRGEPREARADEIRVGRPVLLKTEGQDHSAEWEARFPGGHLPVTAPARAGL